MQINSELLKLGILDKGLPISRKIQVSMSITRDELQSLEKAFNLNLDIDVKFNSILEQELSQSFHKEIFKEMNCSEEFLDVMNLSELDGVNVLYNYLRVNEFDFIICSSQIGVFVEEFALFNHQVIRDNLIKLSNGNTFYKLGEIGGISVYIDAYKRWDDKTIICGKKDSFYYNYEIDVPTISNIYTNSFSGPKFGSQLNYEILLNKNNFINLHYVNEYNAKYVQFNRDKKLDELL
jgi:hypothetical protein